VILFLLAHNDDEFFFAPFLRDGVMVGKAVRVCYITHGSLHGADSEVRRAESREALGRLGVGPESILDLGRRLDVFDGTAAEQVDALWPALCRHYEGFTIDRIYAPAWEGGHADHDIAHLLAAHLRTRLEGRTELLEVALYNGYRMPKGLFRVMCYPPAEGEAPIRRPLSLSEALGYSRLMGCYPSQWKSFAGLAPGILYRFLWQRQALCRRVGMRDYGRRPHAGRLLYESRFHTPWEKVERAVRVLERMTGKETIG